MTVQHEVTQQGVILTEAATTKIGALLGQEGRDDLRLRRFLPLTPPRAGKVTPCE